MRSSTRGRIRLFWAMMTLGLAFWLAYQGLWLYFEVLLRSDVPNPFVGDVVLFLHLVPMTAALAMQPHVEQDERTTRLGSLDFAMLLIWWLYLYVVTVIPWQYVYRNEHNYDHNLNILYLIEKIVFLAAVAVLWFRSSGSWRTVYASWFGAGLTYSLSSYLANWAIDRKTISPAAFTMCRWRLPWPGSPGLAFGRWIRRENKNPPEIPAHGVWVARLGMIAISSLPLFAAWSVFDAGSPQRVRMFRLFRDSGQHAGVGHHGLLEAAPAGPRIAVALLQRSQRSFDDLRRVQAQLVQSEKLASLGQLVGGAAHELNNPLTAMLGYSESADRDPSQRRTTVPGAEN